MIDYLPYFEDTEGNRWEILDMSWCVDWGGRQCHITCQRNNGDTQYPVKSFVIYGVDGGFCQWDRDEVQPSEPVKGKFYECVMQMFKVFDTA